MGKEEKWGRLGAAWHCWWPPAVHGGHLWPSFNGSGNEEMERERWRKKGGAMCCHRHPVLVADRPWTTVDILSRGKKMVVVVGHLTMIASYGGARRGPSVAAEWALSRHVLVSC